MAAAVFAVVFGSPATPAAAGPATSDSSTPAPAFPQEEPAPAVPLPDGSGSGASPRHHSNHSSSGGYGTPLQPPAQLPSWSGGSGSVSSGAS